MKSTFFLLASVALVNAAPQLAGGLKPTTITLPVEPRPTCGPCLNSCVINCPVGKDCHCPMYCDPKLQCSDSVYEKREAQVELPSITLPVIRPAPTCGPCLNDCIVNCPPLKKCTCPDVCDPKYECKELMKKDVTELPSITLPVIRPTPTCGPCLNGCIVACPPGKNCNCPAVCDPKYECSDSVAKRDEPYPLPTIIDGVNPSKTSVVPMPTRIPCGCLNDCLLACPPGKSCNCPAVCDPKYECKVTKRDEEPYPLPTIIDGVNPSKTSVKPMPTRIPCGCLNDCVVNCPPGEICKCTKECDPKYFCKETVEPVDPIVTGQPVIEY
ncbi:hypothetical protein BJ508DRAFT_419420 [Ascobolus immersus RN42]|uniref:Uncharacterized protein n=1 Tax=Ascobolus immersus RN42 TaxID=1160509 RepID=A0A3N4HG91_ASCIM|nr:hypothetical protein BJ508DRAFT_419420 [Ascobolus immersus RN42]